MKKLAIAALALFALAACGPQNNGSTTVETGQVTVTVRDPGGNGYTGYFSEPGSSSWQSISFSNGQGVFNVVGSRYGVAIVCGSDLRNIQVGFFSKNETTKPTFTCFGYSSSPSNSNILVNVDASQIASAASIAAGDEVVVNGYSSYPPVTLDANFRASGSFIRPGNTQFDLVIAIKSPGYPATVKVAKIVRNVTGNTTSVNFLSSDLRNPATTTLTNLPPSSFSTFVDYAVVTGNKTGAGSLRMSNTSYYPVAGFQSGDTYVSFAEAFTSNYFGLYGEGERIVSLKGYSSPITTVGFPSPWSSRASAITITAKPLPAVSGLSYPRAIAYSIGYSTSQGNILIWVSPGFLNGSTSFDFEELRALLDSRGYTPPSNGARASIEVVALTSTMGLEKSLRFINAFGSPDALSLYSSDLDIQLANARKSYVVDGSNLVFP